MRRPLHPALLGLTLALSVSAPASAKLTPTITSFAASNPPSATSGPNAIAAGPDGNLWFTDPYAHKIGRMTTGGVLTLQVPTSPSSFEYDIAAGPDGAMWFVSQVPSQVGRIDSAGNILTKAFPDPSADPTKIVSGPEHALWIAAGAGKTIARVPAATPLQTPDESRETTGGPTAIAAGPDGDLWFTEYNENEIGRMAPSGKTTYFPLPAGLANPVQIAAGADGALWYYTLNPGAIVRTTTAGLQQPFTLPSAPFGDITTGSDGALWIADFSQIVRITLDGVAEEFPLQDKGAGALGITAGPDGNVWFTEANDGRIGRITTPPNTTTGNAGQIGAKTLTISGTLSGHSQPTSAVIEYAPADGATATSSPLQLAPSAAEQPVSISIGGLAPKTEYRYRLVATNPTGSSAGAYAQATTTALPNCKVKGAKAGRTGAIKLSLKCSDTTSVVARAKTGKKLYGKGRAKLTNGKATLRIKPTRRSRAHLKAAGHLRVKIAIKSIGGGTSTTLKKGIGVSGRGRTSTGHR